MKTVTDPTAKKLWTDDLRFLASQAQELLHSGKLNAHDRALIEHITTRTIAEHIAIATAGAVVSGY